MVDSPLDATVSALIVRALLAGAELAGIARNELELHAGLPAGTLDPSSVADPDARLPARVAVRLWQVLPALTQNQAFGLWLAERTASAPLTVAAWFVLSSPNVEAGLARAVQFQRLLHDRASGELVRAAHETRYVHRVGDAAFRAPSPAIEFGFAQLVLLVRRATGRAVVPSRVQFQHARPADLLPYRRLFGEDVRFGAERDEIAFERATCELPVISADSALGELVHAHARALLARLPEVTTFAARVRRVLAEQLPETAPNIDTAAAALALSKRTLQRRLKDEGTSFEAIADDVRRSLAERYLKEQRLSVQETAFLLGYSEVSAF